MGVFLTLFLAPLAEYYKAWTSGLHLAAMSDGHAILTLVVAGIMRDLLCVRLATAVLQQRDMAVRAGTQLVSHEKKNELVSHLCCRTIFSLPALMRRTWGS